MADTYNLIVQQNDPLFGLAATAPATRPAAAPAAGEQTGTQHPQRSGLPGFSTSVVPGFGPRSLGTYDVYDKLDADDTVALVRSIVEGPIVAAGEKYVKANDGVPDEWVEAVRAVVAPLWQDLVRDCLSSGFTYGNAPFELVWSDDRRSIVRAKPLRPQWTEYLADDRGNVRGVVNRPGIGGTGERVELVGPKAFWWTYKGKFGDPYGTSRHEPIVSACEQKWQLIERLGQLARKYAGVTTQLHFPEGMSKDANGAEFPNFWLGKQILDAVARGESVMFNNLCATMIEESPKQAAELAGKSQWQLSGVDVGSTDDYTKGIIEAIAACDHRIVRGWLRPERAVLEAEHGSRADAQQHTATGTVEAQLVANDLARAVSRGIADLILVLLFGERARGAVRVESNPIDDGRPRMLLALVTAALGNPVLAPDVWQRIDRNAMFDQVDLPLLAQPSAAPSDAIPPGGKLLPGPTPPAGGGQPKLDKPADPEDGGAQALSLFKPAWRRRFERQQLSVAAAQQWPR